MNRKLFFILLIVSIAFVGFAQESDSSSSYIVGKNSDENILKTIETIGNDSVNDKNDLKVFEDKDVFDNGSIWFPIMNRDVGYPSVKYVSPGSRKRVDEGSIEDENKYVETEEESVDYDKPMNKVLGVKVDYIKRANMEELFLVRREPIVLDGVTKAVSILVCGRNYNHKLYLRTINLDGMVSDIPFAPSIMNFYGWKKMVCYIPPTIGQLDPNYEDKSGYEILGLVIKFDVDEMYRDYYVYFDNLKVYADLGIAMDKNSEPYLSDMIDQW